MESYLIIGGLLVAAFIVFKIFGNLIKIVVLTVIAIFGAKTYFQILGMYNRSSFVFLCYAGIAGLGLAVPTVRFHLRNVYRKLDCNHRKDAVAAAVRMGIVPE